MTPAIVLPENKNSEANPTNPPEIFYPSEDGEPLAETSTHADAIIATVAVLRNYLAIAFPPRSPVVLADQFLYYAQGFPRLRVAPDIMVIFEIPQVPYDNYKIWETGKVPSIIFEMTSASTQLQDKEYKRHLYEDIGVQEYWLFDPKGEWIPEKLRGYQLQQKEHDQDSFYYPITDLCSQVLGLRFQVEENLLGFYQVNTGGKLLMPEELQFALQDQKQRAEQEYKRAEQESQRANAAELQAKQLRDRLIALGLDPDAIK